MTWTPPDWIFQLPVSNRPCASHNPDDERHGQPCWRVYMSNEDIDGLPDGMKQVRCPEWTPVQADFEEAST